MIDEDRLRKMIRDDLEHLGTLNSDGLSLCGLIDRYQPHTGLLRGTIAGIISEEAQRLMIVLLR